ncbi:hypothetical protein PM082_024034 [Marasmius tenuissimus]|nr:hypothetical protein PM082_024034 [Marasmius tenuissimus]
MPSATPAARNQSNIPRASGDTSGRVRSGSYANSNANPLANIVHGDNTTFAPSTYVQNNQCQDVRNHYTNCNFTAEITLPQLVM